MFDIFLKYYYFMFLKMVEICRKFCKLDDNMIELNSVFFFVCNFLCFVNIVNIK